MFQRFLSWIRGVLTKMLHIGDAKQALKADVSISADMQVAVDLWAKMFMGKPPWLDDTIQSIGLPAAIAGEIARLITVELDSKITGGPRADYLQQEYQLVLDNLRANVEVAVAGGGMAFKPYVDSGHIVVDCVPAWRFLPTAFNCRGEVTGRICRAGGQGQNLLHTHGAPPVEQLRLHHPQFSLCVQYPGGPGQRLSLGCGRRMGGPGAGTHNPLRGWHRAGQGFVCIFPRPTGQHCRSGESAWRIGIQPGGGVDLRG